MNTEIRHVEGSVTAPSGYLAAGVACGVQTAGKGLASNQGKRDVAIIVSDRPAAIAGVFTSNQIVAAPVVVSAERASRETARGVALNSGNANACVGPQGRVDAEEMAAVVARGLNVDEASILVCSTGKIGEPLPMVNVRSGIGAALRELASTREAGYHAALAIMTSDTRPKEYAVEVELEGVVGRIGGIAKGAGMIEPRMRSTLDGMPGPHATMLSVITTDFSVQPLTLKRALKASMGQSFHCITVDGDMSTNDTVLLFANGAAENPEIADLESAAGRVFQEALDRVTLELAKAIVRDGERISKVVTIRVSGARSDQEADAVARCIGNSSLVKTSWCGSDPNWGRILDAIGYAEARVVESKVSVGYAAREHEAPIWAFREGVPTGVDKGALQEITRNPEFELHVELGLGDGQAILYASDLTQGYVEFNLGE